MGLPWGEKSYGAALRGPGEQSYGAALRGSRVMGLP